MPSVALNSGFETGALAPWIGFNAVVTTGQVHQGFFKAVLTAGGLNSFIYQFIPVVPGENGRLVLSLAKESALVAPVVTVTVQYYTAGGTFLGFGVLENIQPDGLPIVTTQTWKTVYSISSTVPATAATALIVINALPTVATSSVAVDDVELVFV